MRTLVIVHWQQWLDQWVGAMCHFLGLSADQVGQIGGGRRRPGGLVDVATIQSLFRQGAVDDVVAEYGHVIVDECHHVPAVSFERVVSQARARCITGLSATVVRKDGHQPIVFMQCGSVRHRVDDRGQARQRPFLHRVIVRQTDFRLSVGTRPGDAPLPIQSLYEMLAGDEARNRMIVSDVVAAVEAGRCPVLLTERREHLAALAGMLAGRVEHVVVMKGGMGKRQRERLAEQIAAVPACESRLIVATGRYLGEGFDDERLDTLFLALPISWRGTLAQYAGRLHRLSATKQQVLVYDYVDSAVPVLARMHARRRAGYRAIGYTIGSADEEGAALQLAL